ncbi:MAG TPA: glycosyltransferase family 39 protein [Holophagaceae bacterium]|nr:glycosyltransferase family 39 protein [Holophagaceae bacterium]
MTRRERWTFLFIWAALGLLPLFLRPLWEPDEARYAEIPREMLATGDWLTPRLNGVLYFEKPPLQYWLSAASLKLFGQHPAAARLPLALATALAMWCGWRLAKRLGAREPKWAFIMAASALLGFVVGQILTLDALFSAFVVLCFVAAVEAVAARAEGRPALGWTLLCFGAMSLAFLTKGLAAAVLPGGALLLSLFFAKGQPALRKAVLRVVFDPFGWLLAAALTAPWFVAVDLANPGHAKFFFVHEHFARFLTHEHARQGSDNPILDKLYFLPILAAGLLPWLSACVTGLRRAWSGAQRGHLEGPSAALHRWTVGATLLAAAWPFFFFSVSGSKLPPYILPVVVPLCALACTFEREGEELKALRRMGVELLVLGGVFLAGSFVLKAKMGDGTAWMAGLGLAWIAFGLWCLKPKGMTTKSMLGALAAILLLLSLSAEAVAGADKEVGSLVRRAPADAQWISFGVYRQGIPFHSGQRAVVVDGTGELAFGRDHLPASERDRWFVEDRGALLAVALRLRMEAPGRPVWILADPKAWDGLPAAQMEAFEVVARSRTTLLLRLR